MVMALTMMQFLLKIPRNLALFLALSSIFVVQPFVGGRSLVLNIIIALSILSSIYSLTRNRRQFVIASVLGVPGLVIGLLAAICRERRNVDGLLPVDLYLGYVALGLFLAFFLYSVYGIAVSVFKQRRITADVLLGAICAYLLLGMAFAVIFAFLQRCLSQHCVSNEACMFGRSQSCQERSQNLVAWTAVARETDQLKPVDKAVQGTVSELPGRNESERQVTSKEMISGGRVFNVGAKAA